jgi:hypothetical protein
MDGRTEVRFLFDQFKKDKTYYDWRPCTGSNEIDWLLIVPNETLEFWPLHPELMSCDCTFKMTRHGRPVLNIIFVDGEDQTVPFGLVLMPVGKSEADLTPVWEAIRKWFAVNDQPIPGACLVDREVAQINAINTVFFNEIPLILCFWHAQKDALTWLRIEYGKPTKNVEGDLVDNDSVITAMDLWYQSIKAKTQREFDLVCIEIDVDFRKFHTYLAREWWPYRELIVRCWVDNIFHFKQLSTSRTEGSHGVYYHWLETSGKNLLGFYEAIRLYWDKRFREIRDKRNLGGYGRSGTTASLFFSAVVYEVTSFALEKVAELLAAARAEIRAVRSGSLQAYTVCSGVFSRANGLPCLHDCIRVVQGEGVLRFQRSEFHKHWWINRNANNEAAAHAPDEVMGNSGPAIFPPRKQRTKQNLFRKKDKKRDTTGLLERIPSTFESVANGSNTRPNLTTGPTQQSVQQPSTIRQRRILPLPLSLSRQVRTESLLSSQLEYSSPTPFPQTSWANQAWSQLPYPHTFRANYPLLLQSSPLPTRDIQPPWPSSQTFQGQQQQSILPSSQANQGQQQQQFRFIPYQFPPHPARR